MLKQPGIGLGLLVLIGLATSSLMYTGTIAANAEIDPNTLIVAADFILNKSTGRVLGVATGSQWYVSPTGSASGNGSQAQPWDLQTALNHPSAVKPGDTIWLLSGSYSTSGWVYYSKLKGTADSPIVVRGEPGKRVTIDGSINTKSSYTWYMDFEIWQSKARSGLRYTECISTNPGINYDPNNPVYGDKFIHLVLHDCSANGIGGWRGSEGNEFYGNLVYFTGDYSSTENRGIYHGIYSQNVAKTGAYKEITDNIVWGGWNEGVQTYSSGDPNTAVTNYKMIGNTSFLNGILWGNAADSFFAATGRGLKNLEFLENMSYDGRGSRFSIYQGVEPGSNLVFRNNYLHGQNAAFQLANTNGGEVSGNVFISKSQWQKIIGNSTEADFQINNQNVRMSNNQYYGPGFFSNNGGSGYCDFVSCWQATYGDSGSQNFSTFPTGVKVFVRPSKYETGRANVTVFNWDKQGNVSVDLSGVLKIGDQYEVRDSQNYFGPVILSGTYNGGSVSLPMNLTAIAAPVASPQPKHTSAEFNAFIVRLAGGGGAVLPPPTTVDNLPPSRFTGSPSGKLNAGTASATLSLSTNEAATCKYSVSAGTAYDSMTGAFSSTGGLSHFASVSGLADGNAYAYYVRCRDQTGNTNTDDYNIGFSVSAPSTPPPAPANAVYQYYEAESGTLSAPMSAAADANASNGQYIASSAADSGTANYGFNVSTAGAYVVWMRLIGPSASQDSVFVSMDGASEDVFDMAENKWSPNWQWVKVNGRGGSSPLTLNPKLFNLTVGSHTLNIRGREVGGKIDKILITNDQGFTPTDSGSQPTTPPATGDSQAPSITLQQPSAGQNISGSIDLKASATDNVKVISFYFLVDGVKFGSNYTEPPVGNIYIVPFDSRIVADGTHTVSARAQDAAGNVTNSPAVSFTVKNTTAPPPAANQKPAGYLDGVDQAGKVFGWARDPDNLNQAVQVHIYIDKNAGAPGASPTVITASDNRSDVGNHAFNYLLPDSYKDGKTHQVWVWAIDLTDVSGASNFQLTGSPKTFSLSLPATTTTTTTLPPTTTTTTLPPATVVGVAAHWTFDTADTVGNTLADKSGNNRPLTLSTVNQQATGKFSQAGSFNGSSGYGSAGNVAALNLASDLTLSAWVKTSNTSRTETILGKYDLGGYESGYLFWVNASGRLALRLGGNNLSNIYDTSLRTITDTGKAINDNQWHHVAAVIKLGQGVTFYVDGVQTSAPSRSVVAATNSASFFVGRTASVDYGYGAYFTGELDDVRVYSSALTAADITALAASSGQGSPAPAPAPTTTTTTTLPPAPAISNLTGSEITATSSKISWATNIPTNGQVFYGQTNTYGFSSALVDDSPKTLAHSVNLVNLIPDSTYHFMVRSRSASGVQTQTADFTFKTLAVPVVPPAPTATTTPQQTSPNATTTPGTAGGGTTTGGSASGGGGGGSGATGGGEGGGGGQAAAPIVFIPPSQTGNTSGSSAAGTGSNATGSTTPTSPSAASAASAGKLVKYKDNPTVYVIADGVARPIKNQSVLNKSYPNRPIAALSASEQIQAGPAVGFGPGTLMKSQADPTIWLVIDDGSRYGFKSAEEFRKFGYRFDLVAQVADTELKTYPLAQIQTLRYHGRGNFIKYPDSPTVYMVDGNSKRALSSPAVFFMYASAWTEVLTVGREFQYADGPKLAFPDGTLVKGSAATVYYIQNGQKHALRSPQSLYSLGFDFSQIKTVDDSSLQLNETGSEM